ncbi:MAG: hypothetical protein V4510_10110 [bacterium]
MSAPTFSTNAFNNVNPARGAVAESVKDGALSGVLGGSDDLVAGDRVKIDDSVTTPGLIQFVAAADNEAAFGTIKYNVKQDTFAPGDTLEVVFSGGLAVYQVGGGTLTPGTPVAMGAGVLVAVDGTHLQMGLLLDYVVVNSVGRVIVGWVAA